MVFLCLLLLLEICAAADEAREKPTSRMEGQRLSCTPTFQEAKETRVKRNISRNFSGFTGVRNRINITVECFHHQRNLELLILYALSRCLHLHKF